MENQQINLAFEKGEELLSIAQEELYRPEEDIVTYMVYQKAKLATSEFLISFLTHYGIEVSSTEPQILLNQCRKINPDFNELNIDPMIKVWNDKNLWINSQPAKDFVTIAEETRAMVLRTIG